jgi:hypothetical protein
MAGQTIHDKNLLLRTMGAPRSTTNSRNWGVVATESSNVAHRGAVAGTVERLRQTKRNLRTGAPLYRHALNVRRARVPNSLPAAGNTSIEAVRDAIFGVRKTRENRQQNAEVAAHIAPQEYVPGRTVGPGTNYKSAKLVGLFKTVTQSDDLDVRYKYVLESIRSDPEHAEVSWLLVPASARGGLVGLVKINKDSGVRQNEYGVNANKAVKNMAAAKRAEKEKAAAAAATAAAEKAAANAADPTKKSFFNDFDLDLFGIEFGENSSTSSSPDPTRTLGYLFADLVPKIMAMELTEDEKAWWWANSRDEDKLSAIYHIPGDYQISYSDKEYFFKSKQTLTTALSHRPEELEMNMSIMDNAIPKYSLVYDDDDIQMYSVRFTNKYPLYDEYDRHRRMQQEVAAERRFQKQLARGNVYYRNYY